MTKISAGLAALSVALILSACSTTKPTSPPPTTGSTVTVPAEQRASSVVPGSAEDLRVNVGDTVHFAYNAYNIEDNDRATLQRQAAWLQKYPAIKVLVEGDCDERGTREYNLALGARRANAVKEYLVSLGVSAARVDTISYGKEHPICSESTEDCWAQNRRGVTSITAGASS